jgi:hypothetical protein
MTSTATTNEIRVTITKGFYFFLSIIIILMVFLTFWINIQLALFVITDLYIQGPAEIAVNEI